MTFRLRLGVAIGAHEFAASWCGRYWETLLPAGPTSEAIRDVTEELKRLIGLRQRASLSVAILPPIAKVRRVTLPRMNGNDLRLALTTNARQYFIDVGDAPVCGAASPTKSSRRAPPPVLAFAADSTAIDSIVTGLTTERWTIDRIVPAQFAWANSTIRRDPRLVKGTARVGVRLHNELNVLELQSGSLVGVRRYRASGNTLEMEFAGNWHLTGDDAGQTPAILAATGARAARRFEILPAAVCRARATRDRRASTALFILTCATAVGAATEYRLRLQHQLTAIAARRSAIRPRAAHALASRDSAEALAERTTAMQRLVGSASRWSAVLSHIAIALPEDVELRSIRAEADSLAVEGSSAEASRVVSVLQRTPGVKTTRLASPIVRESLDGEKSIEQWRLALRIDHHAAVRQR